MGEPLVHRRAGDQPTKDNRATEQVNHHAGIDIGPDLPAPLAALDQVEQDS